MQSEQLLPRLDGIAVSNLSDADKTLALIDPAVRAIVPGQIVGPAYTATAPNDPVSVIAGISDAAPGDVLVVATRGGTRAVLGDLFAFEARRRGLAGIVIDGFVRDIAGLRAVGLPVYARGLTPMAALGYLAPTCGDPIVCGGAAVRPGDLIIGDEDGLIVVPPEKLDAVLARAGEIAELEGTLQAAMEEGRPLKELTNFDQHIAAVERGEPSRFFLEA